MDGSVPADIAREKQQNWQGSSPGPKPTWIGSIRSRPRSRTDIDTVFDLARRAADSYRASPDEIRRDWNLARYESLDIDIEDWRPIVAEALRTPIFEALHKAQIPAKDQATGRDKTGQVQRPPGLISCRWFDSSTFGGEDRDESRTHVRSSCHLSMVRQFHFWWR